MRSPIPAILWAQWRIMTNFRVGGAAAVRVLAGGLTALWYLLWAGAGVAAGLAASSARPRDLAITVPWVLLVVFGYWQLAPILTASLGATLDLRKLLAWPIPERSLFAIEVALRVTTGFEMILLLAGGAAGLAANPAVPAWAPALAFAGFALFSLFVSAGLRNLLDRLFARKWLREALVLLFVLAAAAPQLLLYTGWGGRARALFRDPLPFWPWTAAAQLATGERVLSGLALLALWTAAAYHFGRWQFHRSLGFDASAAQAAARPRVRGAGSSSWLYRWPSLLFRDPLAALVEKELASLARTPRFRLVFLMGFSFGFIIWLPVFRDPQAHFVGPNYPVGVALYGLVLLAEVVIWNAFGFDRGAARLYFAAPVDLSKVLLAKNVATLAAVLLEVAMIAAVCAVLPLGVPAYKLVETCLVTAVAAIYMTATGNLSSVYYPRAIDPEHTWGRSGGTRFQLFLVVLFPVLLLPVLLAYAARYAFASEAAFYAMLALAAAIGLVFYWVALDSALEAVRNRREQFLAALTSSAGPLSTE